MRRKTIALLLLCLTASTLVAVGAFGKAGKSTFVWTVVLEEIDEEDNYIKETVGTKTVWVFTQYGEVIDEEDSKITDIVLYVWYEVDTVSLVGYANVYFEMDQPNYPDYCGFMSGKLKNWFVGISPFQKIRGDFYAEGDGSYIKGRIFHDGPADELTMKGIEGTL